MPEPVPSAPSSLPPHERRRLAEEPPQQTPSREWLQFCQPLSAAMGVPAEEAERLLNHIAQRHDGPEAQQYEVPGTTLQLVTAEGVPGALIWDTTDDLLNGSYLDSRCLAASRALLGELLVRALELEAGL